MREEISSGQPEANFPRKQFKGKKRETTKTSERKLKFFHRNLGMETIVGKRNPRDLSKRKLI